MIVVSTAALIREMEAEELEIEYRRYNEWLQSNYEWGMNDLAEAIVQSQYLKHMDALNKQYCQLTGTTINL